MPKGKVICLMGLTGTGKTALAMHLYDNMAIDIISVDSAMIYRGMDIGTAKPTAAELKNYPHHLIDILEPEQHYSAAAFVKDASQLIEQSFQQNKIPLLVGGTMLYFKALQQGLNQLPESSMALRQQLNQELIDKGLPALYLRLKTLDPQTAAKLSINDPQRIIRALEIFELSGKPMSELLKAQQSPLDYQFINIALIPEDRTKLHLLLEQRFNKMLAEGFQAEVERLNAKGLTGNLPAMRCVGYKQMLSYLNKEISYLEMKQQAIASTRQLAKRQHTWLRKWPQLYQFDPWQANLYQQIELLLLQ